MSVKNSPERMCVACRKHGEKSDFVRVVRTKDGVICIDTTTKAEGRGAYICASEECIDLAEKKNAFSRAYKENVDKKIYDELRKISDKT